MLRSDVELTNEEQDRSNSHTSAFDIKTLRWTELLELKLPFNFDANLGYRYEQDTSETDKTAETEVQEQRGEDWISATSSSKAPQVPLFHLLYDIRISPG